MKSKMLDGTRVNLRFISLITALIMLSTMYLSSLGGDWNTAFAVTCPASGFGTGTGPGTAPTTVEGCLVITSGDNQTANAGTALTNPLVVTFLDTAGMPKPGFDVVFSVASTPSGTAGSEILSSTTANGVSDKIAFTSYRNGNYEIYLMNSDGTGAQRLTNDPAPDLEPAIAPGRTRIAFVSVRDGNPEIFVMNADGTGVTRLTNTSAPVQNVHPTWSPDGSKIGFMSDRDGNPEIFVMNADGTGVTQLTNTSAPVENGIRTWSPDGSKIAFHSNGDLVGTNSDKNDEIFVMNANGTGITQLTTTASPVKNRAPAWSPDGSKIAFKSDRDGNLEIFVMNATNGTGVTQLTTTASPVTNQLSAWSPDGSKIVFESDRDTTPGSFINDIYTMNATDGSGVARLTTNTVHDGDSNWGVVVGLWASGRSITVVTDSNGQASVNFLLGSSPGTYTVTASSGMGAAAIPPVTFTATASGGVNITLSASPTTATVGQSVGLTATVTNSTTNTPAEFVDVSFSTTLGNLSPSLVSTNNMGEAIAMITSSTAGTATVTASAGTASAAVDIVFSAAAPATITKFTGDGQSEPAGTTLMQPMGVWVLDAMGFPISGVTVTFVKTGGTGGSLADDNESGGTTTTAATDSMGFAYTTLTLGTAGVHTVTATCATCTTTKTVTFTATAFSITPDKILKAYGDAQTGPPGAMLNPMVAQVINAVGDPISGVTVTFAKDKGTLDITSTTTDMMGFAYTTLTLGTAGAHNVTATCAACTTTTTAIFTATAATPSPAYIIGIFGDGQQGLAGATLPYPMGVIVFDAQFMPVSGVTVTFAMDKGTLSAPTTVATDANGQASTTLTLRVGGTAPDIHTVTATCAACTTTPTAIFTATVTSPGDLIQMFGDNQSGAPGAVLLQPMVVAVLGPMGNPVPGVTVTFAKTKGTLTTTTTTTDSIGQASTILTLGTAGIHTVTATCAACGTITTVTFTATALTRYALSGTVTGVDALGTALSPAGVSGASVSLSQVEFGMTSSTTTAADGTFTVNMVPGSGTLSVSAAGFMAVDEQAVFMSDAGVQSPSQTDLIITAVQPGVTITGTVQKDLNGNGDFNDTIGGIQEKLVGAFVWAMEADPSTASNPTPIPGGRAVYAITGGTGAYSLAVPKNTYWTIAAYAIGFGDNFVDLNNNNIPDIVASGTTGATGQNITFSASANLTGSVKVDGAFVALGKGIVSGVPVGTAPSPGMAAIDPNGSGDGDYTMPLPVPPEGTIYTFVVYATVENVGDLIPRGISVNSSGRCLDASGNLIACTLNFNISTSTITVNFKDGAGNPVTVDSSISATSSTTVGTASIPAPRNMVTVTGASSATLKVASAGAVSGVTSKTYNLDVFVMGFGELTPTPSSVTVPCSPTGTSTCATGGNPIVTVTVPVSFTISGKVQEQTDLTADGDYNDAGETVVSAGATVEAVSATFAGNTTTAADGTYSITVPGQTAQYQLTAFKAGFTTATKTLTVSGNTIGQDLNIQSTAGQATISGVVAGPTIGIPVTVTATSTDGRTVSVSRGATGPNCGVSKVATPTAYCMTVGIGTWSVTATADGYTFQSVTQVPVTISGLTPVGNVNIAMTKIPTKPPKSQQCADNAGCRAEASGSRIIVTIPGDAAGNTGNTITVTIKETTDAPKTATFESALRSAGGYPLAIEISVKDSTGKPITQFSTPITFRIEGLGAAGGAIVGFFNEATGNWTPLFSCTGDATGITCTTTHLTKFSVLTAKVTTAAPVVAPSPGVAPVVTPVPTATPAPWQPLPVSQPVNVTTGGTVGAGPVTVVVPPQVEAGVTGVTVAVQAVTAPPAAPTGSIMGSVVADISLKDQAGNPISEPDKAVKLTFSYFDADLALAGGNPNNLFIGRYNEATGKWEKLTVTVNAANKTLTIETTHFTKFAVLATIPSPTLSGPVGGAMIYNLAPLLTWQNPAGTTQYNIQVIPYNNDGPGINLIRNVESSYQVQPPKMGVGNYVMLPGMTYTWRVRSTTAAVALGVNDPGWSEWTALTFKTQASVSWTISPVGPYVGSTAESLTPTLTWANSSERIFYYEVQLSKDPEFNTDPASAVAAVYWELVHGGVSVPLNSYKVRDAFKLESGSTYYWRVRPRVQGDGTAVSWSDTWSFKTP